jgi:hypothetical protein
MTATYSVDDAAPARGSHPLRRGASPEAIRAHLHGPEDQAEFDQALSVALDGVKESRDLTDLFRMLEQWRRIAILQSDPERFRRVVRRAAEANVGRTVPQDEPLAVTRARAGL